LEVLKGARFVLLGVEWCNFHVVFAVSVVLRILSVAVVTAMKEPKSKPADEVFTEVIGPALLRRLILPVDIFWRYWNR
jgi:hypothetical protein